MLAGIATLGYGACVFGFGLVFRPLESDESVTLQVASLDSVRGVLDAAVNYRHGPPLHYLLVHAALAVRDDVFGLRLPSALLGMAAVGLAYGFPHVPFRASRLRLLQLALRVLELLERPGGLRA